MVGMAAEIIQTNYSTSPTTWAKSGDLVSSHRDIIAKQATLIIGLIGHVAHGKSTIVKALTGVSTTRFKKELERNITIKLGYANAKIYKCSSDECPRPGCYRSCGSSQPDVFACDRPGCRGTFQLVRHVSFVDCPGHDGLMSTMLNGSTVMDAALMVVAANEPFPQPQTTEHLVAMEMLQVKNLIILQNKIDLVQSHSEALQQAADIRDFMKGTVAENAPIIPLCAQLKYNVDVLCEYLATRFPIPERDITAQPQMKIIRSFDINKPGCPALSLKGGVVGGCVMKGVLEVGQDVEIRPGRVSRTPDGQPLCCYPIVTKVVSIMSEQNKLTKAVPGGFVGVGTVIEPQLCQGDRLVGQILGSLGSLPTVYSKLEISCQLLRRLQGVRTNKTTQKPSKVGKLEKHEHLLINIGSQCCNCRVISVDKGSAKISLDSPVCAEIGQKVTISRLVDQSWRLIGWGEIQRGVALKTIYH